MEFKPGAGRLNAATAILLGDAFTRVKKAGALTPHTLLDDARPAHAPTHGLFEWDDKIAGEKYRIEQAGFYLRSVDIMVEDPDGDSPIRVRAVSSEGDSGYDFTTRIMKDPERRKNLLAKALAEFNSWKIRWETLEELAGIFEAADKIVTKRRKAR